MLCATLLGLCHETCVCLHVAACGRADAPACVSAAARLAKARAQCTDQDCIMPQQVACRTCVLAGHHVQNASHAPLQQSADTTNPLAAVTKGANVLQIWAGPCWSPCVYPVDLHRHNRTLTRSVGRRCRPWTARKQLPVGQHHLARCTAAALAGDMQWHSRTLFKFSERTERFLR